MYIKEPEITEFENKTVSHSHLSTCAQLSYIIELLFTWMGVCVAVISMSFPPLWVCEG